MAGQQECEQEPQNDHGDPDGSTMKLHVKLIAQGSYEYGKLIHRCYSLTPFKTKAVDIAWALPARRLSMTCFRVCLFPIPFACSRLRRYPDGGCGVDQALGAWSTPHPPCFVMWKMREAHFPHNNFFAAKPRGYSVREEKPQTFSLECSVAGIC